MRRSLRTHFPTFMAAFKGMCVKCRRALDWSRNKTRYLFIWTSPVCRWLRGWFEWRYGLTRLITAIVFLGAFMAANLKIVGPKSHNLFMPQYWGWPFPYAMEMNLDKEERAVVAALRKHHNWTKAEEALLKKHADMIHVCFAEVKAYQFPSMHQTYRYLDLKPPPTKSDLAFFAIVDILVALVPLFLILFLQIPRRKVAVREGGRGARAPGPPHAIRGST